jgi:hypothetical protein
MTTWGDKSSGWVGIKVRMVAQETVAIFEEFDSDKMAFRLALFTVLVVKISKFKINPYGIGSYFSTQTKIFFYSDKIFFCSDIFFYSDKIFFYSDIFFHSDKNIFLLR